MLGESTKKKVTLSVDTKTYDEYMQYCEDRGMILSKQVEFFMKEELEQRKHSKKTR